MSTEEKFRAAVNVIRNLPKTGSVKPSYEVMLKFYGYYKQATDGPNVTKRPAFWDIVKKTKWDAWANLGDMSKDEAMRKYVDEFKKIVDGMTNVSVSNMDQSEIDSFYASVPVDDLELLIGPVLQKVRSQPGSPLSGSPLSGSPTGSREVSPTRVKNSAVFDKKTDPLLMNGYGGTTNNSYVSREDEEEEDEYFLDTFENSEQQGINKVKVSEMNEPISESALMLNGGHCSLVSSFGMHTKDESFASERLKEMKREIADIAEKLRKDLDTICKNMSTMDRQIKQLQSKEVVSLPKSSPLFASSITTFLILFSWPVVLHIIVLWVKRRKSHRI